MQRFGLILRCFVVFAAVTAGAGTYTLTDGNKFVGQPEQGQGKESGMLFKLESGDTQRVPWDHLTPEALQLLLQEDKNASDQAMITPLIENSPTETSKFRQIVVTPPPTPPRPLHGSGILGLFASPVGFFLLLVLYGANIYAAYEVAVFRNQPIPMVCGLAAIPLFGVASPIYFISMPSKPELVDPEAKYTTKAPVAAAVPGSAAAEPEPVYTPPAEYEQPSYPEAAASAPPTRASKLPDPVVFTKGEYTFNRRFIETKFANFFRLVPAEAEKDLVLLIKSSRGEFVGRRITKVTPNELYLQVFSNNATADEMIPFIEITEMQIRHQDSV